MQQLVNRISVDTSILPNHVTVMTWFAFLLNQCARPYQSAVIDEVGYIRGLNFIGERPRHVSKSKPKSYYLDSHRDMFRDGVAAFAFEANRMSDGKVVNRLASMYDHIYVDEVQDMADYDLNVLELLMKSPVAVTVVGDPRQATFATNQSCMW